MSERLETFTAKGTERGPGGMNGVLGAIMARADDALLKGLSFLVTIQN